MMKYQRKSKEKQNKTELFIKGLINEMLQQYHEMWVFRMTIRFVIVKMIRKIYKLRKEEIQSLISYKHSVRSVLDCFVDISQTLFRKKFFEKIWYIVYRKDKRSKIEEKIKPDHI